MKKNAIEVIDGFIKNLDKLTQKQRDSIQKLASEKNGTFVGAAWAVINHTRYSPHKPRKTDTKKTKTDTKKTKTDTKTREKSKVRKTSQRRSNAERKKSPAVIPVIKYLKPNIRTIILKKVK